MPRDFKLYLEDVAEAITKIQRYTAGVSVEGRGWRIHGVVCHVCGAWEHVLKVAKSASTQRTINKLRYGKGRKKEFSHSLLGRAEPPPVIAQIAKNAMNPPPAMIWASGRRGMNLPERAADLGKVRSALHLLKRLPRSHTSPRTRYMRHA